MAMSKSGHQPPTWTRHLDHPFAPLGLAISSDFAFTCMDGTVQLLEMKGIDASQVFFMRMFGNAILCSIYYLFHQPQSPKRTFCTPILYARGLANAGQLGLAYAALAYLPFTTFTTVIHLRPFAVAFLCWVFLGERVSKIQITACIISFAAVLLVVQPGFAPTYRIGSDGNDGNVVATLIGVLLTVACLIISAVDFLLCRKIGDSYDVFTQLYTYVLTGTVLSILWMVTLRIPLVLIRAPLAIGQACFVTLCGILAQLTLTAALQRAPAVQIAILGYLQIISAAVWQGVILHRLPNVVAVLGMAIIISAGSWSIVRLSKTTLTEAAEECTQLRGSPKTKPTKEADTLPMHERAETGGNAALTPLLADVSLDPGDVRPDVQTRESKSSV